MRTISFVALAIALYVPSAFGCSIDALKKVAEEHIDRLPSSPEHEFSMPDQPSEGGGGSWQVFEKENGTPHSIVVELRNELGKDKIRVSFENRRDFVIILTGIMYADIVLEKEGRADKKYLLGPSEFYFFCDNEPQLPLTASDRAKALNTALYWRKWFFDTDELKPDISRIPE